MSKYYIYQLVNPATLEPFYVGSTKSELSQRLARHMWVSKNRPNTAIYKYINSLGAKPLIRLLDFNPSTTKEQARAMELYWMEKMILEGHELMNTCDPVTHQRLKNAAKYQRGPNALRKLQPVDIKTIRQEYAKGEVCQWELGERYNIPASRVCRIVNFKIYKDVQ